VGGDAQDVHAAGLDFHHEQDVQAPEEHGVNVQEIARQNPGCLGGQELPPGRGWPAWRGRGPGCGQDPADRSRANAVPQAEELKLGQRVGASTIRRVLKALTILLILGLKGLEVAGRGWPSSPLIVPTMG
jgi:hypothetical protein